MPARPPDKEPEIESSIDALYDGSPGAFVAARNQLAKQLRAAGQREHAARVKALTRPAATAWAVNHAWWHARAKVQAVLDAGESLRQAQLDALRGRPADLRGAITARDKAVARVAETAIGVLESSGEVVVTDSVRRRVMLTLETLASAGVPAGVTLGRLTGDLASTGVDVLVAIAATLPAAPDHAGMEPPARAPAALHLAAVVPEDRDAARRAGRGDAQPAEARAALADAEAALDDAERQWREARQSAEDSRTAAAAASARVEALEEQLTQARESASAARRQEHEAARSVDRAERARRRAFEALETARRCVAEAGRSAGR